MTTRTDIAILGSGPGGYVAALRAAVASGASWGLMLKEQNQFGPFEFRGAADDPVVYRACRELTAPREHASP